MPHRFFRNWTTGCTIGFPVDHRDGVSPWQKRQPVDKNGSTLFIPPGGIWSDVDGNHHRMVVKNRHKNLFVRCENEDQLRLVQDKHPDAAIEPVREGDKLRGFFGALYVLEDVTHIHQELLANSVNLISAQEHIEQLKKDAADSIAAKAAAEKLKAEKDALSREHESMKRELEALRAREALANMKTSKK